MNKGMIAALARPMTSIFITGACVIWSQGAVSQEASSQEVGAEDADFLNALLEEADSEQPEGGRDPAMTATAQGQDGELAESLETIPVATEQSSTEHVQKEQREPPRIEEIVVTATKRAEPLREIPATISVLTGADLERQGVQSIDQIVTQVPGVNLADNGGAGNAKRVTIRGVSPDDAVPFTAGTLLGDIPFTDPFIPKVQLDPNPFDMATVEVLKGPQGTLFGGSGLNGMIRYVPEAPQFDSFRIKYFSQYSSYPGSGGSGWSYGAVVNAPFADQTMALRLMGFYRDAPGYIDDTSAGKKDVNSATQYGIRGILAWTPSDAWKVSLLGTTQSTKQDDVSFADNRDGRLERGNTPRPSPSESRYTLGNLSIERRFDWGDVVSQSSYFEKQYGVFLDSARLVPGGPLPLLAAVDDNHSEGITQELRLVSSPDDSPWKWLAGAFYYDMHLYDCAEIGAGSGLPTIPIPPLLEGVLANPCPGNAGKLRGMLDIAQLVGDIDLQETALFGELTREASDAWELTLGVRAYETKSGGTVSTAGVTYAAQNLGMATSRDAEIAEHGFSPKASIAFNPTDELRAYFTAARGFRFGGPQLGASTLTTTVPETYKSDSLWSYELGLRTDWLDRSLQVDGAIYRIDWKNPQVLQISTDQLVSFIDNVGEVKGHGAELSLTYLPEFAEGLSLSLAASWNRTETDTPFRSSTGRTVPAGSPWPLAPRWQTSSRLAYSVPLGAWNVGGSVRHMYMGSACNTIECTAQVFGYRTVDLNLFAAPAGDSAWPEFSLTASNIGDERGYSNINTAAAGGITYIAPRALVFRVSGQF